MKLTVADNAIPYDQHNRTVYKEPFIANTLCRVKKAETQRPATPVRMSWVVLLQDRATRCLRPLSTESETGPAMSFTAETLKYETSNSNSLLAWLRGENVLAVFFGYDSSKYLFILLPRGVFRRC